MLAPCAVETGVWQTLSYVDECVCVGCACARARVRLRVRLRYLCLCPSLGCSLYLRSVWKCHVGMAMSLHSLMCGAAAAADKQNTALCQGSHRRRQSGACNWPHGTVAGVLEMSEKMPRQVSISFYLSLSPYLSLPPSLPLSLPPLAPFLPLSLSLSLPFRFT